MGCGIKGNTEASREGVQKLKLMFRTIPARLNGKRFPSKKAERDNNVPYRTVPYRTVPYRTAFEKRKGEHHTPRPTPRDAAHHTPRHEQQGLLYYCALRGAVPRDTSKYTVQQGLLYAQDRA